MEKKRSVAVRVVIRRDQDRALDRIAGQRRDRSKIIRDALDRYLTSVPDAEFPSGAPHVGIGWR